MQKVNRHHKTSQPEEEEKNVKIPRKLSVMRGLVIDSELLWLPSRKRSFSFPLLLQDENLKLQNNSPECF
jgi:hypothetical protein